MSASSLIGSSINDFPVEILATIFKMIHSDLLEEYSDDWKEVSDDELLNLSLFPYSISTVCRYWDAIMALFAEFWTRVVVRIDQPDHLELLKLSINRAQPLKLRCISVIRSSQDSPLVDPLEKSKVQDIFCVLSGHCPPSRSLVIKTLTMDSLPAVVSTTFELRTLRLESHQRGTHAVPPDPLPISNHTVHCDNLSFLSLTGPIFATLWRNGEWRLALSLKRLDSLTIAHLRAEDGGKDPFTFQELWSSFRNMRSKHLSWVNVDVPYGVEDLSDDTYNIDHLGISSFTFDTVPASVLRAFYYRLRSVWHSSDSDFISLQIFRNCSFYGCPKPKEFPFSTRIEVSGISNPDCLSLFFEIADNRELLIDDCPGLDDSSMSALTPFQFCDDVPNIVLPRMSSLEIRDCPNFSVCVLQDFVEFRHMCSKYDGGAGIACAIDHLSLVGSCPPLSEEEKEWFKDILGRFENENLA